MPVWTDMGTVALLVLALPSSLAGLIPGGELPSDRQRLLREVQFRSSSPARTAFAEAALSPESSAFQLAALIAAEETYPDVTHDEMSADLVARASSIADDAVTRLRLSRLLRADGN